MPGSCIGKYIVKLKERTKFSTLWNLELLLQKLYASIKLYRGISESLNWKMQFKQKEEKLTTTLSTKRRSNGSV